MNLMRGPLTPKTHGFLDYGAIALLFLAPMLFGITGTASTVLLVVAVLYLGLVLLTAYPLGTFKVLPFPVHGYVEAALALFLAASPWLFGFTQEGTARNFFLAAGLALGGVFLLTDYQSVETPTRTGRRVTV